MNRPLALVVAAIFAVLPWTPSEARIICDAATTSLNSGKCYTATTNPPTADLWSNGGYLQGGVPKTFSEITQDSSGSWYPTSTLGTQTLGTAALPWNTVYAGTGGLNSTGPTTATGAQTLGAAGTKNGTGTGNATSPAAVSVLGGIVLTAAQVGTAQSATTGIYASTTIPYLSSYQQLESSASIVMSATPTIATVTAPGASTTWPTGAYLVLTSTGNNTITLQSQGTLSGSGLRLGAATRVITVGNQLTLIWNATIGQWVEAAFSAGTGN